MNCIVCVKAVPALPVEFDVQNNSIKDTGWNYILNPYDEVAMEEALRLREEHGGTVTAVTLGPARSDAILRACLATGADNAVRIDIPDTEQLDGFSTAKLLGETIKKREYRSHLCGYRSLVRNAGEVGGMLAEFLHLPSVTSIGSIDVCWCGNSLGRLERGAREIACPLPALFTDLCNEPRYPTTAGKKAMGNLSR